MSGLNNSYTGTTTVSAGTLVVDGSIAAASAVTVESDAILGGDGSVGGVDSLGYGVDRAGGITVNGTLAASNATPAAGSDPSYGTLAVGNLVLGSTATFAEEIGGTTAGTNLDQVNVGGTVGLGGSTLALTFDTNFTSTRGDTFVLLTNDSTDAVTGTFANVSLNGGAASTITNNTITAGNGHTFLLSYTANADGTGGAGNPLGNDITLTDTTPAPIYSIGVLPTSVDEGTTDQSGATLTYTLTRTGDASQASQLQVELSGSATLGTDYTVTSGFDTSPSWNGNQMPMQGGTVGVVSFAAGASTATITIATTPDSLYEGNESVTATLLGTNDGGSISTTANEAMGTITDDDAAPSLALTTMTLSQNEGNSGTTAFAYTVTRTGDAQDTQTVGYTVTPGGVAGTLAASRTDFVGGTLPTGSITFDQGDLTQTITIPVQGDQAFEFAESFTLTLGTPNFGSVTPGMGTATGTIVNDDAQPGNPPPPGPTAGDDNLTGTGGADTVALGLGNDTFTGGAGADLVYGNQGNDLIYGNQDADVIYGGQSDDIAYGGMGDDRLYGNLGNDVLYGNLGADIVYGNQGADIIYGNQGNDVLYGGQGDDILYGGMGDDILVGGVGNNVLVGGVGADRYVFGANLAARDLVLGFNQGEGDRLSLGGQTYTTGTAQNGDALLMLSGGGTIDLAGIRADQVNASYFVA